LPEGGKYSSRALLRLADFDAAKKSASTAQSADKNYAEQRRTTVTQAQPTPISPEKPAQTRKPETVATASPQSRDHLSIADGLLRSAPNLNSQPSTKKRVWPKPFTPEEERYRQQIGVQAFINYQHELATGQSREELADDQ
jgi:hypothetical protein